MNIYKKLLKQYADALIPMQDHSDDKYFRGGIRCHACKMIHGRSPDAVYGFTLLAKLTGESKYLDAAKSVFDYGDNMLCTDGALYNDAQAEWRATTTFHLVAVIDALRAGKDILDDQTKSKWEKRALGMAEWLFINLDEHNPAHINYAGTNGYALTLAGRYFGIDKYVVQGKKLIDYAMQHFTDNDILFGECTPHNALSAKNCNGIDIGYNVEESVPSLVKYAYEVGDEQLKNRLEKVLLNNLDFMFPDGAWDNSFGNRNYKWTYWGSRTSDGCATGYLLMADRNPQFAEAVLRNTLLLEKCSQGGLLYGGPDYARHGEHPCTHHAFEHLNALAFVVEHIDEQYLAPSKRYQIPCETGDFVKYYPECRTYRLAKGDYLATVTDNDFNLVHSGHATGGTLTALFKKDVGPIIMSSTTLYVLVEPTNMQQVLDRDTHRSLTPRIEIDVDGVTYYSSYFDKASFAHHTDGDNQIITVDAGASDRWLKQLQGFEPKVTYTFSSKGVTVTITNFTQGKFVLPLINGSYKVQAGTVSAPQDVFFLIGGFCAKEYTLTPDQNGILQFTIC